MEIHLVIFIIYLSLVPQNEDQFKQITPLPGPVEDEQDYESFELENGKRYEMEVILNHKKVGNTTKYLIKWKRWANQYNEWKSEFQLRHNRDLINEYWIRKGDRSTATVAGAAASKKPRGRSAIANTGNAIINATDPGAADTVPNSRND